MSGKAKPWIELKPRFIVDETGRQTEVILDFETYMAIVEELEYDADSRALDEAIDSETSFRDWDEVEADLRDEGLL